VRDSADSVNTWRDFALKKFENKNIRKFKPQLNKIKGLTNGACSLASEPNCNPISV